MAIYIRDKDGNLSRVAGEGKPGADGKNGESAYQIAVDNGFEGTEEEWLASLKGTGVPTGGATGQVLKKVSDIDNDTEFGNVTPAEIEGVIPVGKGGTGNTAGYITAGQKLDIVIGEFATAEGRDNIAWSDQSHAEGGNNVAGCSASMKISSKNGNIITVYANAFLAQLNIGDTVYDNDENSYEIININSNTITLDTDISDEASHIYMFTDNDDNREGVRYAHAEGGNNRALAYAAHAEGANTIALGAASHAEGGTASALGDYSHSEGSGCKAVGAYTHAEGAHSIALGNQSHAEGNTTTSQGDNSHAEGYRTTALGNNTHAEGYQTIATSIYSHVQGKNNIEDSESIYAHIVGNGTSKTKRSNAHTLDWNGNAWFAGNATVEGEYNTGGADYAELREWLDGNPSNQDRVGLFVTMDGSKIKLATADSEYILGVVSAIPSIVGNVYDDHWFNKYLRDDFGRVIWEMQEIPAEIDENGEVLSEAYETLAPKLNPLYNDKKEYIGRTKRPEWSPVGMLGELTVYDDGTCQVNGYCKCNNDSVATTTDEYVPGQTWRVIKRVKNNIIKIIFR